MKKILSDIKTIIRIILFGLINSIIYVICLIFRDKRIVLFGAWMGERFADNSRFLYQYLTKNKGQFRYKRVIWVTRNRELYNTLKLYGYDVVLIGTLSSIIAHVRAGIHIICNMSAYTGIYKPDIDVLWSAGAHKIQLWHGVGIKAVGTSSKATFLNDSYHSNWVVRFSRNKYIKRIGTLGCWGNASFLCTSNKNAQINILNSQIPVENAFIASYPRHCECLELLSNEIAVLRNIMQYNKRILYLPTFQSGSSDITNPTSDERIMALIENNNFIWIEKRHQADKRKLIQRNNENILELDSSFDINVILKEADCIITDYSSVAFDGIFLRKFVIMYAPDLDSYMNDENGLLYDPRDFCPSLLALTMDDLFNDLNTFANKGNSDIQRINCMDAIRNEFFEKESADYYTIWNSILDTIKKTKKK